MACVIFNIYSPQNNNIPDSTIISYHCTIPNQIHGCKQNNYILFLSTLIQTPQLFRNGGCRLKMKNTYWLHHQSITYSISYLSLDCIHLAADYICLKAGSIFKEMLCAVPHNKHSLQPVLSCNRHENLILQNGSCNVSHTTCLFALQTFKPTCQCIRQILFFTFFRKINKSTCVSHTLSDSDVIIYNA